MGSDTTYTRINGTTGYIGINCTDRDILFTVSEKKGHTLSEKTPLYGYENVSVHDGEAEYFKHGGAHQQCLAHLFRYLQQIEEAEEDKKWASDMNKLLHEITKETDARILEAFKAGKDIHDPNLTVYSKEEVRNYYRRYLEILDLADKEYPVKPTGYVEGFNTKKRLREQMDATLYFLDHPWVPWHNNASEQGARTIKRKTKQSDGFRSLEGAECTAIILSVVYSSRKKGGNIYNVLKEVFSKPNPKSQEE